MLFFFFQNEYVGDFARVIAGQEIIFLNLISSIESGLKICRIKYHIYDGVNKEAMFQEIFLPSWGLMTEEVSSNK